MEDRYLFKAKIMDNGEWVIGYMVIIAKINYYICPGKLKTASIDTAQLIPQMHKVDGSTICQCTGLKDKNGKLIFEDDILSGHIDDEFPENETRKRVVWYENGWCTREDGCIDYDELDDFDSENFKVCGNKFDNPELLESEE